MMIQLISHRQPEQAARIYQVFQRAYPYEARLLGVKDDIFPPLKRSIEAIQLSDTHFYGYFESNFLAGVVELTIGENTRINSFVVDPNYFKQGIGSRMMQVVLENEDTNKFIVETGKQNVPAIALYKKFGFEIVREYDLPQGIVKVVMELDRQ